MLTAGVFQWEEVNKSSSHETDLGFNLRIPLLGLLTGAGLTLLS